MPVQKVPTTPAIRTDGAGRVHYGSVERGLKLYETRCLGCHGHERDGTGPLSRLFTQRPPDLRDPMLLLGRTDAQLMFALLNGVEFGGVMTRFARVDTEHEARDLLAALRHDSIWLEDCFPQATHYLRVPGDERRPLLVAYAAAQAKGQPRIIDDPYAFPSGVRRTGYVMFTHLWLGERRVPAALLADVNRRYLGLRLALPFGEAMRYQAELAARNDEALRFEIGRLARAIEDEPEQCPQELVPEQSLLALRSSR
jgi:hypothetical protein